MTIEHGPVDSAPVDAADFLGRTFISIGDDNFIPTGTSLTCVLANVRIEMSYENPRAEISAGFLQIEHDGGAFIEHDLRGIRKAAKGWVDILRIEDHIHVLGEWLSVGGDAWGEIRLFESKPIAPP